jgi:hypothetical protein
MPSFITLALYGICMVKGVQESCDNSVKKMINSGLVKQALIPRTGILDSVPVRRNGNVAFITMFRIASC